MRPTDPPFLIEQGKSLAAFNSLGIEARAQYYACINSRDDLCEAVRYARAQDLPMLLLGGGSNIVLTQDVRGLVLHINTQGIACLAERADEVDLRVCGGESWHQLVLHCTDRGFHGLENLAHIPGRLGAAPVQNIGAYGVELSEHVIALEVVDLLSAEVHTLSPDACGFGYRSSHFKNDFKGRYVIDGVHLRLSKLFRPRLEYGALRDALLGRDVEALQPRHLCDLIGHLRAQSIPAPSDIANVGCFFSHPVVSSEKLESISRAYPDVVSYPLHVGCHKLAAGWLVERCGWKGYSQDGVQVSQQHALVLLRRFGKGADALMRLADAIRQSVHQRFGVDLDIEPTVY